MVDGITVTAVIVAAGASTRMGFDKLSYEINGKTVLELSIKAFLNCEIIDEIVVVAGSNFKQVAALLKNCKKPHNVVKGGAQRANSVLNGVNAASGNVVAIHDAARPFVPRGTIEKTIKTAIKTGACAPAVPVKDTIKIADKDGIIINTPNRDTLFAVQTPQCFLRKEYLDVANCLLADNTQNIFTDDCSLYEAARKKVTLISGDYSNIKITTKEDLQGHITERATKMRIGHGYDVHKLVENRKLILGGVTIEYEKGLLGHSDADVLCHAVSDALLGAAALGDIGKHFPDTCNEFENADSVKLLCKVAEILHTHGYKVHNLDATIVCQAPKLAPHIEQMRKNIANAVNVSINEVSVKATTEEKLGFTGEKLGIAAHCVCLIEKI